jgi:hypothetical protein
MTRFARFLALCIVLAHLVLSMGLRLQARPSPLHSSVKTTTSVSSAYISATRKTSSSFSKRLLPRHLSSDHSDTISVPTDDPTPEGLQSLTNSNDTLTVDHSDPIFTAKTLPFVTPTIASAKVVVTDSSSRQRWRTGLILAVLATGWVSLPTRWFTLGFTGIALVALSEYQGLFQHMNVVPAVRTTRVLTALFFLTALYLPQAQSALLTLALLASFAAHLTNKTRPVHASDVLASVFACLYLGYFPSYWSRLHAITSPWFVVQLGKLLTVWTFVTIIAAGE